MFNILASSTWSFLRYLIKLFSYKVFAITIGRLLLTAKSIQYLCIYSRVWGDTTIFINSLHEWPSPTLRTGFMAEVSYNISKPYQVLTSQSIPCSDKDQWFHILSPSLTHRVHFDHLPQTFTWKLFFLFFGTRPPQNRLASMRRPLILLILVLLLFVQLWGNKSIMTCACILLSYILNRYSYLTLFIRPLRLLGLEAYSPSRAYSASCSLTCLLVIANQQSPFHLFTTV